jgi:hypothetical protein
MTTQDGAAQPGSSIDSRLGCSTISFRAWTLPGALATSTIMSACGRRGTEPGTELSRAIATVARTLTATTEVVSEAS